MKGHLGGGASPAVVVLGAVVAAVVVVGVAVAAHHENAEPDAASSATEVRPLVGWCADGLEAIRGGGCFAAARSPSPEPKLLVYLHGIYAPTAAGVGEELDRQARVAAIATTKGYSVLALRGRQGQCRGADLAESFCWPSNGESADRGTAYVDGWAVALAEAEGRSGRGARFLLGFSNGGYFAAIIAGRALAPFAAIAIAGAGGVEPIYLRAAAPPLLLLTADGDPSIASTIALDEELTREHWPHAVVTRDGGHGLVDSDVAMAIVFFDRARGERFPLTPPLSSRPPRPITAAGSIAATDGTEDAPPSSLEVR